LSTEIAAVRRRANALLLLACLTSSAATCAPHASPNVADLCRGRIVSTDLTLVIDTTLPPAPATLRALTGQRYHMTLRLMPQQLTGSCGDASGQASYDADLPDELNAGISRSVSPTWLMSGPEVVVDFNPQVASEHLELRLPLDGSTGHWTLTSTGGQIARGRVLTG